MVLKGLLVVFVVFQFLYTCFITSLIWKQRSQPLPECVAHIYDKEKYEKFLEYKKEYKKLNLYKEVFSLLTSLIFILSDFYQLFDFSNPYVGFGLVYVVLLFIHTMFELPMEYYATFHIEEKYGKNHQTKKEFFKDYVVENLLNVVASFVLFFGMIFIFENIESWTNGFNINYMQSFMLCLMIVGILFVLVFILSLISLLALRMQYTFTEMEACELKSKIEGYCKESKKKVSHIKVYDESKKSNSKNAFLLKLFGYREFGIADNFLDENSEDELLAVLLHEVGHLKHKKNGWNYLSYLFLLCLFGFLVWLIPNVHVISGFNAWINESFGLVHTNYYLTLTVLTYFLSPLMKLHSIYSNFVSRKEEEEADYNAVDKGYGQALIDTFTKLSGDELIDVNPHPWIERMDYSHPGMATRIGYIQKRMKDISCD